MKVTRDAIELEEARSILLKMEADPSFVTKSAYRANVERWPKHRISFIELHMEYLHTNPQITTKDYISNLRLKLRKTSVSRT